MQSVSTPGSPTSRLLLEYEMHLRNTLAKGMDAESYSLRTFEALLTQSMENLGETRFNLRQEKGRLLNNVFINREKSAQKSLINIHNGNLINIHNEKNADFSIDYKHLFFSVSFTIIDGSF